METDVRKLQKQSLFVRIVFIKFAKSFTFQFLYVLTGGFVMNVMFA